MKRLLLIVALVFVLQVPLVFALTYNAADGTTFTNGYAWTGHPTRDRASIWAEEMQEQGELGGQLGTGKVFYVDSGRTASGDGTAWTRAFITLDEAFASGKATANRGDFVLVAQGHNESLTLSTSADCDVAGVTILGFGNGTLRPTFDYDAAAGKFNLGAGNIRVENLRFRTSTNTVATGVYAEATADGFEIVNCEFLAETKGTDEFTNCIVTAKNPDGGKIVGNKFNMGAASANHAIAITGAMVDLLIANNFIMGDYAVACIGGDTAADELVITNNVLFNGTMAGDGEINSKAAISLLDATSGLVANNTIISDVATTLLMRVADDMVFMNNIVSDTDGDEFSGTIEAGISQNATQVYSGSITGHEDG